MLKEKDFTKRLGLRKRMLLFVIVSIITGCQQNIENDSIIQNTEVEIVDETEVTTDTPTDELGMISELFPDENLAEIIVRDLTRFSVIEGQEITTSSIVTQTELDEFTFLTSSSSNISDLTGVEYLTNLIELRASSNKISDLTPLSHLTNLVYCVI